MKPDREVVAITGSHGLIGSALMKRLSRSFDVVGLDVEQPVSEHSARTEGVYLNLGSEQSVTLAIKYLREVHHGPIASVIHLASYYDFSGRENPAYDAINIDGTRRLLNELRSMLIEQVICASTMLVHAPCQRGERINEDSPLHPQWEHPRSSFQKEKTIQSHHGDIPFVVLRIAGVYDDFCHSVPLAHQIQRIYEHQLAGHVFPGHTSHGQAFIHLDDLVDVFVRLIERRQELPSQLTLLIGEPETVSYREIQDELGKLIHGSPWHTYPVPRVLARAGMWAQTKLTGAEEPFLQPWMIDRAEDHYALDITRARTLLGWVPWRSLRETLPKMVAALKADPRRWYREHELTLPSWLDEGGATAIRDR